MIQTTEPAEASLTARIEELGRMHQQCAQRRQEALRNAQGHAEEALRIEGAIEELSRWKTEIWGDKQGESDAGK